jgi:hypothetical protein
MMVTDRGARANHGLTAWWEETIDRGVRANHGITAWWEETKDKKKKTQLPQIVYGLELVSLYSLRWMNVVQSHRVKLLSVSTVVLNFLVRSTQQL